MGSFRSLWRAVVSFGLVSIPVKVYAATDDKEIHLRQLHDRCHSPIQYRKWCPVCQVEVTAEHIVPGYELAPGRFATLSSEEMESLPLPESHVVQILDFVSLSEVDPVYFERAYYLEPAEGAGRAYRVLVQAMQQTGRIAVARMAMRRRESLAALRPLQDVLNLVTVHDPDEVRPPSDVVEIPAARPSEREAAMAVELIGRLTVPFEPSRYRNERRQAFAELLERKATGEAVVEAPQVAAAPVADLVEALKASLQRTGDRAKLDGRDGKVPAPSR